MVYKSILGRTNWSTEKSGWETSEKGESKLEVGFVNCL